MTVYNRVSEIEMRYRLLQVLEFDSDRKRMSVIVRDEANNG
jgi:magnesium-transporting ATPase (P-type)